MGAGALASWDDLKFYRYFRGISSRTAGCALETNLVRETQVPLVFFPTSHLLQASREAEEAKDSEVNTELGWVGGRIWGWIRRQGGLGIYLWHVVGEPYGVGSAPRSGIWREMRRMYS